MNRAHEYTIREAAALIGLPESTLRYYETIGLLDPIARDTSSKHRRYTENDIDMAIGVACLNATGMSIDDMRAYLKNRTLGDETASDQIALLENQLARLVDEARSLHLRQRYIDVKIAYWRAVAEGDSAERAAMGEQAKLIANELRVSKGQSASE